MCILLCAAFFSRVCLCAISFFLYGFVVLCLLLFFCDFFCDFFWFGFVCGFLCLLCFTCFIDFWAVQLDPVVTACFF